MAQPGTPTFRHPAWALSSSLSSKRCSRQGPALELAPALMPGFALDLLQFTCKDLTDSEEVKPDFYLEQTPPKLPTGCQPLQLGEILPQCSRSLLIPKRNNFFCDKKLNGLLLPVIHVAVQLISVHT